MKAIGNQLFLSDRSGGDKPASRESFRRISARDAGLKEAWFRDAIFANPELVIGPCRNAGRTRADEVWLPWRKEHNFGSGPVDVLLVSSEGRVGIVETKLSYNPERRREVVAQVLDYALALQVDDFDSVNWPALPKEEMAPDMADLRECIEAGRFLLVVAGDALDPRAVRLSQAVLGRSMTSEWDLVMVDLNLFESSTAAGSLLIVPELLGSVESSVRNVVRVQVGGDGARARVQVEHVTSDEESVGRAPRIDSADSFLSMFPDAATREVARRIIEKYEQVIRNGKQRFNWGFRSSTANLYWLTPEGGSRRIFSLARNGRFRAWIGYLEKGGYQEQAERMREEIRSLMEIPPGEQSGRTEPDETTLPQHMEAIDRCVAALSKA